jgi:hypothetical protein
MILPDGLFAKAEMVRDADLKRARLDAQQHEPSKQT